jgi:hypothetical protein
MSSGSDYYKRVSEIIEQLRPSLPEAPVPRQRRGMFKRIALIGLLSLCFVAVLAYGGDYAVARYRLAKGDALGSVDVQHVYAIPQKSGKTEFDYVGADAQTCVRSLFPHFGYAPCWYVSRHRDQRTQF